MAQKHIVQLIDDLDGVEAQETVSFALDGTRYEIDLSAENAARLRDSLAVYVASARRSQRYGGNGRHAGAVTAPTASRPPPSGNGPATTDTASATRAASRPRSCDAYHSAH